jgi:hypothetical protein
MSIYPVFDFQVTILGDNSTSCNGKCHKVEVSINDCNLRSPMYAMVIGGVGIILGAQWVAIIGIVGLNLQTQFLIFYENGNKYKVHGIMSPHSQ